MSEALVKIENLKKYFPLTGGVFRKVVGQVHAVDEAILGLEGPEVILLESPELAPHAIVFLRGLRAISAIKQAEGHGPAADSAADAPPPSDAPAEA